MGPARCPAGPLSRPTRVKVRVRVRLGFGLVELSRALRDKGTDPISEWNDAARLQVNQLLNLLKLTRARLSFTHESFQFQPVQMPIIINPSPSSFPLPRLRLRNEEVGRDTQRIVPQINSFAARGIVIPPGTRCPNQWSLLQYRVP